jgi:hypothetical protein
MDADPELHPTVFRQTGVARSEDPLDLDGALDAVQRGRELGEEVVTTSAERIAASLWLSPSGRTTTLPVDRVLSPAAAVQ